MTVSEPFTKKIKSASIILQRSDNKVLICKRSEMVSFFPTFWVFPGGKIEDKLPSNWIGTEPEVVYTILQELYEEVGIIPGLNHTVPAEDRSNLFLDYDYDKNQNNEFKETMEFIGRKITPPFQRKFFDVAYYYIKGELIDNLQPLPDDSELLECIWITPDEAIKKWEKMNLKIPPLNLHLLRTLAKFPDKFRELSLIESDLQIGLQTRLEFSPGFELIPLKSNTNPPFRYTNLTIIRSDNDIMIVDPGTSDRDLFVQLLLSLPSTPKVFLTHHHHDHWEGLKYVEEIYPESILYSHPKTLEVIQTNLPKMGISDGIIKVGQKSLEIIFSPGHTKNHLALFDTETGTLIAGDHVVGYGPIDRSVICYEDGDMQDYFETCHKLASLNANVVFPSHGPPHFNPSKLLLNYITHRQQREEDIQKAIDNGNHTLDDILCAVYQDVPKEMWESIKNNIKLHIRKLGNEKKLPYIIGKLLID